MEGASREARGYSGTEAGGRREEKGSAGRFHGWLAAGYPPKSAVAGAGGKEEAEEAAEEAEREGSVPVEISSQKVPPLWSSKSSVEGTGKRYG